MAKKNKKNKTQSVAQELALTREHFLAAAEPQKVFIKGLGGFVYIRPLGLDDVAGNMDNDMLLSASVVDAQGNPIFKPEDIAAVKKRAGVAAQLLSEITKINGFNDAEIEEAKKN